jgi:ABC-2 type transport system permease protein
VNLWKYFEVARVSFRESFAYRLDAMMGLINSSFPLLMYYFIWGSITSRISLGSSLNEIMVYYVTAAAVQSAVFVTVERSIGPKIQHGTVVNELKRPISFFLHTYFHQAGKSGFDFLMNSLPVLFLGFLLLDISVSAGSLMLFLFSVFLSFNLVFLFSYAASMMIFWTKIEWAIRGSRTHIQKILSGSIFPLFLIPEPLQSFFYLLPFQAMIDAPVRILTGSISMSEVSGIFLNQLFWITVFLVLAKFSWKKAKKKLTVQGG